MNVVTVKINDMEYSLTGSEDPGYIKILADYVNEKVRAVKSNNRNLGTSELSVLAAINIVDELIKLKAEKEKSDEVFNSIKQSNEDISVKNNNLIEALEESREIISRLKIQNAQYKDSNVQLEKENENLKSIHDDVVADKEGIAAYKEKYIIDRNKLVSKLEQISSINDQLSVRASELENHIRLLKGELSNKDNENKEANKEIQEENDILRNKLRGTLEQNKFMEQKTKKYIQELKNLKSENKLYRKV